MNIFKIIALGFCFSISTLGEAQDTIRLEIYHTNDVHSRIEPFPQDYANKQMADKAGIVRRVTFMEKARKQDPELLLFDCGDFSQGSPYYNLFKGSAEIEFMNLCKYDAGIIGNHEFDFGEENMKRIFQEAKFPIVNANYTTEGTPLQGVVKPYIILYRKGLKIGIFGISPQMAELVQEKNRKGMEFLDPVEMANKTAKTLKETEKCDVVICLSHLGWFEPTSNAKYSDYLLASGTRNIDLILGGHTHTYMENGKRVKNLDGKEVLISQMGKNGQWIGHVTLAFIKE